jgi:hypothetical protein
MTQPETWGFHPGHVLRAKALDLAGVGDPIVRVGSYIYFAGHHASPGNHLHYNAPRYGGANRKRDRGLCFIMGIVSNQLEGMLALAVMLDGARKFEGSRHLRRSSL